MSHKAVFLDADGVLNEAVVNDSGKPTAPTSLQKFRIPDEVRPALDSLKSEGYLLICVTNKPDVSEGLMTQENLDLIYQKLTTDLPLTDIFMCLSRNEPCYKPKPQMLLDAAKKHDIDLSKSFMIGDTARDVGAGENAGCTTVWIDRKYPINKGTEPPQSAYTAYSLKEAVDWILTHSL